MRMNQSQFAALAQLLRMRDGPIQAAARLVLVDGLRQSEAARRTGVLPQHVNRAVKACRVGAELARVVSIGR